MSPSRRRRCRAEQPSKDADEETILIIIIFFLIALGSKDHEG